MDRDWEASGWCGDGGIRLWALLVERQMPQAHRKGMWDSDKHRPVCGCPWQNKTYLTGAPTEAILSLTP